MVQSRKEKSKHCMCFANFRKFGLKIENHSEKWSFTSKLQVKEDKESLKITLQERSLISNISVVDPPRTLFMGLDKHESKLTNLEIFLETEEKQV